MRLCCLSSLPAQAKSSVGDFEQPPRLWKSAHPWYDKPNRSNEEVLKEGRVMSPIGLADVLTGL